MSKKLWLVSELFYPETISTGYIMTEIAGYLAKQYDVHVICGPEFYEKKKTSITADPPKNVTIHRVKSNGYNKNSLVSRIIGHLTISLKMFIFMRKKIKNDEQVLLVTNPIFLTLLMGFISSKRNWKIKLYIHDVFPENLVISRILKSKKSIIYKVLASFFNRALKKMDKIVVCGRDMKEIFVEKTRSNNNIVVVENWSDNTNISVNKVKNDKTNFLFAGNLGRLQGLEELFGAISKVKNQNCNFTFIGSGAMENFISNYIDENNIGNVELQGWLPREDQNIFLAKATVGLISLKAGMYGLGVPSKLYNLIAAGKPIFYIGDVDSEIHRVLCENKIGWFAESGNEEMIVNVIHEIINAHPSLLDEYSINARALAEGIYSKENILNKTANLF